MIVFTYMFHRVGWDCRKTIEMMVGFVGIDGGVCDGKFDGKLGVLLSFDYCVSGIYFTFLL